jgi:uncharacterized damage-inducible protein DinB
MSTELERLDSQIHLAFAGGAWHGPSVMESLADVTPEEAAAHPIAGAHSIWELALHIGATYRLVLRRLAGEDARLAPDEDWAPVPPPTEANWRECLRTLEALNQEVRAAIQRFDPQRLDQPLSAVNAYTAYAQFIGITQHDLYHAGQVAILKKAARAPAYPSLDG